MTTILTLEPLSGNLFPGGVMRTNFGGVKLDKAGKTLAPWIGCPAGTRVIRVNYPASLAADSIPRGVDALDAAVRSTQGDMLVFAYSQGAQVASRWLRTRVGIAGAPATNRLRFLLIGNPLRKYGGYGVGRPEVDGATGLASLNNTGYSVVDYKLQYDGFADHPTRPSVAAARNASQDRMGINGNRAIHAWGYRTARLDHPARKTFTEGTTQYVMAPHPPLLPWYPQWLIERGYNRPET